MAQINNARVLVDHVTDAINRVGLDDLSSLGHVCGSLEELAAMLDDPQSDVAHVTGLLIAGIERTILDECDDVDDPIAVLRDGCLMLHRLFLGEPAIAQETEVLHLLHLLAGQMLETALVTETPASQMAQPEKALPKQKNTEAQPAEDALVIDAELFHDFFSEAQEHLESAERTLLVLETNPQDAELLNGVFRAFHTIKGAAGFLNLLKVTRVAHATEDVLDSARKGLLQFNGQISDMALASTDLLRSLLQDVDGYLKGNGMPEREIDQFLSYVTQIAKGEGTAVAVPAKTETTPQAQVEPGNAQNNAQQGRRSDQNYVRVGTEKLDQMVNVIGELVIAQTQVSQNPDIIRIPSQKLTRDVAQLSRLMRDLQEIAMSMRMVPIRSTFERMARMVRDLGRKCDKQVVFQMTGEETELDKNMVEELVDPLTHMVRNAVDHGLESSEERIKNGKPAQGTVFLEAYHKGGNIVIELRDDGKGLNRDKIKQKAIERGLLRPDEELSEDKIYELIFKAGFSTAEQVSDVSGRGVGMDVVRKGIEKLHGKVEVTSEPGKGSRFAIQLPLTLAIIEGMIVGVGDERYIMPLTSIVRSLRPSKSDIFTVKNKGEVVRVQDELYPLLRLYKRFGAAPKKMSPWESLVILVESDVGRSCIMVDELLGIQQVVIKGLDEDLRGDKKLSGCTILGDGRVGLILDVNRLVVSEFQKRDPVSKADVVAA